MTPSLPVPHESAPDDPERPDESAQLRDLLILPPRPPLPSDSQEQAEATAETDAAAAESAKPEAASQQAKPADRPRKPKNSKGKGRGKRRPAAKADPGPPPPLPPDVAAPGAAEPAPEPAAEEVVIDGEIAVPPKPPLPAAALVSPDVEIDVPPPPPPPVPAAEVAAAVVAEEHADAPVSEDAVAADEGTVEEEAQVAVQAEAAEAEPEVAEPEPVDAEPEPVDAEPEAVEAEPEKPEAEAELEEPDAADAADAANAVEAEPDVLEEQTTEAPLAPETPEEIAHAASVIEPKPLENVPDVLTVSDVDPSQAALVLRGVSKSFGGALAVDGVDLTVPAGTFYGLVGPNGAGKTTTLSMIAGLLRPDRGSVHVTGIDVRANPRGAKRRMGVLPDRLRTFDRLTGRQLLYYYGVLRGLPPAVVESRTADLARAFDLTDALGRVVADYSAGMAKKVMLAGAMIHSPRLLVLDEPFEAVDPVSSAIILDILSTYVAHGGTVILSSHGMELVERVCSRVAVLVAGQVLAEGTIDEVRGELTLEQRFIELAGGLSDVEGLEWLHTFSD